METTAGSGDTDWYRPEIDGLRAVAVLLVLFSHAGIETFKGGFVGVDVFFVISGYLITRILVERTVPGVAGLRHFYERRILRIIPALFVTLVLTLAIGLVVLFPHELNLLAHETRATGLFYPNIFLWRQTGYFAPGSFAHFLLHCWSLGVEEQFYFLFPLPFLLLAAATRKRTLVACIALAWIASLLASLVLIQAHQGATFYILPTRAWELLSGSLIALVPAYRGRWGGLAALAGLAGICFAALTYRPGMVFPGPAALLPVAGTAAILLVQRRNVVFRILVLRPARAIGAVSYSLYLVHWPILLFAFLVIGKAAFSPAVMAGYIAVSLAVAVLSWRYVEQPPRHWRSPARAWGLLGAFLLFAVSAPAAILAMKGLPERFSPQANAMVAQGVAKGKAHEASYQCFSEPLAKGYGPCPLGLPKPRPDIVIISDSHGIVLRHALSNALVKAGKSGVILASSGCPPVRGLRRLGDFRTCVEHNELAFRYVLRQRPQAVLLIGAWRGALQQWDNEVDGDLAHDDAERLRNVRTSLIRTVAAYRREGFRVGATLPVPGAREIVPAALARGMPARLEWTLAEHRQTFSGLVAAMQAAHPDVVVDLSSPFCAQTCNVASRSGPLYFDDGHVNALGEAELQPVIDRLIARMTQK